jgi:hypothetical protein
VGTSMEILYGWERNKVVVIVVPDGPAPSPWLVYHNTHLHVGSVIDAAHAVLFA